jgi:hypothetical protein
MNVYILYLISGVAFNFLWDNIINSIGNEKTRFNLLERFIVTFTWPFIISFGVFYTIKSFLK